MSSLKTAAILVLALSASGAVAATGTPLNPVQDIVSPSSSSAKAPLEWLGANGPWFAGELLLIP